MEKTIDNTQNKYRAKLERIINGSGIAFNGNNPWDIKVYNPDLYKRVFTQGSIGFGEAYMDNWWDCDQVDELIAKLISFRIKDRLGLTVGDFFDLAVAYISNEQSKNRAPESARKHYDIGNDLFKATLDKSMGYSCAYWKTATDIDQAQIDKYDLICRKLNLKAGQKVLDIGCGWGGLIKYMAEKYGVSAVGITPAYEQVALATERCKGLPIEIRLDEYRNLTGSYDHIVSLGMFEHVGYKNFRTYMEVARRCLKDDGLFLLHTIGANKSLTTGDPWLRKYGFPGHMHPSLKQVGKACEGIFVIEDVHNFGISYDKTLMAWYQNFAKNWSTISDKYDERFYRLWKYYLLSSAGSFRARNNQLWHFVLSPNGVAGGYNSVR